MVRRILALTLVMALAACVAPRARPGDGASPVGLSSEWLVGGWVLYGESCESDAGVVYRADGSWAAYGATGTWQVKDGAIITRVTAEGADNATISELETPSRFVENVEVIGPNEFVSRRSDGSEMRLVRCPGVSQ